MYIYGICMFYIVSFFDMYVRGVNEVWLLQAGAEEFHTTPRDCDFEQATVKNHRSASDVYPMSMRFLPHFSRSVPLF